MILSRLGNKSKIAMKIQEYFPAHIAYIEPFFGAGGMFFNKPLAKYNIVNDLDSDVYNLFQVVMNQKKELEEAVYLMPIHSDLLNYWKKNKETEPVKKALRFLFLSNFTYLGRMDTLSYKRSNLKKIFFQKIDKSFELLQDVQFNNTDCVKFIKSISFRHREDVSTTFIYNDPPYLGTGSNYENQNWNKIYFTDLLNANINTGCKFAVSEFDNEFVIQEAKKRNLNVIIIGERINLKNRRTEILITNYEDRQLKLF